MLRIKESLKIAGVAVVTQLVFGVPMLLLSYDYAHANEKGKAVRLNRSLRGYVWVVSKNIRKEGIGTKDAHTLYEIAKDTVAETTNWWIVDFTRAIEQIMW